MSMGPDSAREFNEIARKRSAAPKVIGFFVVLAASVATIAWQVDKRDQEKRRDAVRTAWGRLSTCLVGDPLHASENGGEKASVRYRRVQLAVAEEEPTKLAGGASEAWPERCGKYVKELQRTAADGGRAKASAEALAAKAVDLAPMLVANSVENRLADASAKVDALFASAKDGGWMAARASDVPAAPAPAKPRLALADLEAVKPLSKAQLPMRAIRRELHRGRALVFVIEDVSAAPEPRLCVVPDEVGPAECRTLPKSIASMGSPPRLVEAHEPGAAPLVAFGDLASGGIFRSDDGAPVLKDEKFGWGFVRKDGTAFAISYKNEDAQKVRVARVAKDGARTDAKVDLPGLVKNENLYYALGVAPGFLLSRGRDEQHEIRLFAQPLLASGPELVGPAVEIGAVDAWRLARDRSRRRAAARRAGEGAREHELAGAVRRPRRGRCGAGDALGVRLRAGPDRRDRRAVRDHAPR